MPYCCYAWFGFGYDERIDDYKVVGFFFDKRTSGSEPKVKLDCPFKVPNLRVTIWGACDGLVCIGTKREVLIWNPSTGKYRGLPNVEMPYNCYAWFGFGYDECIDDYKVVGFFFDDRRSGSEPEVKVYTLGSDSWRRIEDCPYRAPRGVLGTFVNRALHWIHWLVGSGKIPDPGSLAGNETKVLDVMVKVPHNVLLSLVRDIGADWDIDYELELGLTVDLPIVGNFKIPITNKGQIKLPSLSDLWT
ncbi:hypothetical protein RHGRI_014908 [Rhododendron griersonianum]|uniref:F-box associated domain-containing protein n=1 Tax=Rhododendron griersonianum TaxID=479676 RepID=A0AAV6KB86_9ERIC|nr:hypothetical protein RHGRI_014908 [Rhododendron griersonianum]